MTDIKHTPLPWAATDKPRTGIILPDRSYGSIDTILEVSGFNSECTVEDDLSNRDFIVKACNSYYESQATIASQEETIKELVEVLEDCVEYSSLSEEYRPIPNTERELMEDIESAISKAKGQTDEK